MKNEGNPKKEAYIKALLEKHLGQEGVFRQFEFTSWGMETRPDYVILYPDKFVYYEIKSEYDSFARLEKQMQAARGLFHLMYLVAPRKMLAEAEKKIPYFRYHCGTMALEDLEDGKVIHLTEQHMAGHTSPVAVSNIMWSHERKEYVKKVDISINGRQMPTAEKYSKSREIIQLLASSQDCLKILNDILPKRTYQNREIRERISEAKKQRSNEELTQQPSQVNNNEKH